MAHTPHTTIEKTKKRYKAQMLMAALVFCVGIALLVVGFDPSGPKDKPSGVTMGGAYTAIAGFVWYAAAKMAAWWNHG